MRAVSFFAIAVVAWLAGCDDALSPRPRPGGPLPGQPGARAELVWYELNPRVVTPGSTDSVQLTASVSGAPSFVQVLLRSNGSFTALRLASGGVYTVKLAAADLLFGYRAQDLRNVAGFLEIGNGTQATQHALLINVRDGIIPNVNVQTVSSSVQTTPHVVNLRYDSIYVGKQTPPALIRTFYQFLTDSFDFIAVVQQVRSPGKPSYFAVRNDVQGLGLSVFDRSGPYGSSAELEGIVSYPDDSEFDLAGTPTVHEIAHRWMNHSSHPRLMAARPHWPIGTIAYGVMGRTDTLTEAGWGFPFSITEQIDGTYLVRAASPPAVFNDIELYLMGLLPPDSARGYTVFHDQTQTIALHHNGVLRGPVDTIRATDIATREGARVPDAASSQRAFRLATIVLSRNRLLSRDELAFYDYMATRGASRETVTSMTGTVLRPFYVATGGRATLSTALQSGGVP